MNEQAVLTSIQQGYMPPGWRVWRTSASYFIRQAITYIVFTLLCAGGLIYMSRANFVIVPGFSSDQPLSSSEFQFWHVADLAIIGLVVLVCAGAAINNLLDLRTAQHQACVVMPDGFVVHHGSSTQSVAYGNIAKLTARVGRSSSATLSIKRLDTGKNLQIRLDSRFGNPKPIVEEIMLARSRYAGMMMQQARPLAQ